MHELIRITGPAGPMRKLGEVAGLDFERTSARRVDDDRWQVSGYADEQALAELDSRGLSVERVVEAEELERERGSLYAQIEDDEAGA